MTSPSARPIIKAKIPSHLEQLNHNAAGIDLGSAEHWVCVPEDRAQQNVRLNRLFYRRFNRHG